MVNIFQKTQFLKSEKIWLVVLLFGTLLLSGFRQPFYPTTWIDEGLVLQGAINLNSYGLYALRSSEGFRLFDQPLIANGPGIVLPISLIFKILGIGLLQARFVMVLFIILTIGVVYALTRYLFNPASAIIASTLVLLLPLEGVLIQGRSAIGIVPSIFYFLFGYFLWVRAQDQKSSWLVIFSGFWFGIALVTKGQYYIIIPLFIFVLIADRFYYKSGVGKQIGIILFISISCLIVWYVIQFISLGSTGFFTNLESIRSSSRETVLAFRTTRIPGNLWYLIRSGVLLIIAPSWLNVAINSMRRKPENIRLLLLVLFIPLWLSWFALVSVGWHRYALDAYVMGAILTGKYVVDVFQWLRRGDNTNHGSIFGTQARRAIAQMYLLVLAVISASGLFIHVKNLIPLPDKSPQLLAQYLTEQVDPTSIIETSEWEIASLAPDLTYHLPNNIWVDLMTRRTQFNEIIDTKYDPTAYRPKYLLLGPFAKWTGLYTHLLKDGCCEILFSIGIYDLYSYLPGKR